MSRFNFKKNEVVYNTIEANPSKRIHISGSVFYDNKDTPDFEPNRFVDGTTLNIPRAESDYRPNFVSSDDFADMDVEGTLTRDYDTTSNVGISSDLVDDTDPKMRALKNTLNHYKRISQEYDFAGFEGKSTRLVSIPSMLYGSSIEKGSVELKFYAEGSTVGRLQDTKKNGELIQTSAGNGSGSVAGVVLYNEGFMLLTGSWEITDASTEASHWTSFATTGSALSASSFDINFRGTTKTPVMTMFAHANRGEVNSSNNPTFVESGQTKVKNSGSFMYIENPEQAIKNVVSSSYAETGSFEKTVYISSVGIYDDENNLLGIAKLAEPIRKREKDSYTFKMKIDV